MYISDGTKIVINTLPPETLESHGVITAAPKKVKGKSTYICPACGNGSGKDGDGIVPSDLGYKWWYYCFKCDRHFDNIDLLTEHYGLNLYLDFGEICKRACDDFNIPLVTEGDDGVPIRRGKATPVIKASKPAPSADPALIELIRADIQAAKENLDNLPEDARRGLSLETLRKFGCGYLADWTPPQSRFDGKYATPTPRLIIPSGDHYLARLTVPLDSFPKKARPFIHEKQHAGTKKLFGAEFLANLTPQANLVIVTEGEIDAMSIFQALSIPAVATGGAANFKCFLEELPHCEDILVLILYDSDETGRGAAAAFRQALIERGVPAVAHFLSDEISKRDFNDVLREEGASAIRQFHDSFAANLEAEFDSAVKEIDQHFKTIFARVEKAEAPYRIDDQIWNYILHQSFSDYGDGNRLAIAFGDRIRFLIDGGIWGMYSAGAWQFRTGESHELYPYAAAMTKFIASKKVQPATGDLALVHSSSDDKTAPRDKSAALTDALAERWQKRKTYGNGIEMLKSHERIRISAEDLDNHLNLLNCVNGVVDLETGKLYPHAPEFLLTQKTRAVYLEGYHNPAVRKFLRDIQPDDETRAALIRLLGCAITGTARAEKFGFFTGAGGNGKGTLTSTILYVLGDYGVSLPSELLIATNRPVDPNAPTPAVSSLENKRVAIVEELPPEAKWDVALIKKLTGRDPVPCRNLYSGFRIIDPTWTLFMSGNHEPRIPDANDKGWKRRFLKIDFNQDFTGEKCDDGLKARLRTPLALSGFLTVLVEAAREYYRDGLLVSDEMERAAKKYMEDNDIVASFISDNCEYAPEARVAFKDFQNKLQAEYSKELAALSVRQINKMIEQAIANDDKLAERRWDNRRVIKGLKIRC